MLREHLLPDMWEIKILMHDEKRSPCSLQAEVSSADVLLTPHGFQSMLLMFLKPGKLVFEVFPYRYFKRGYGPFAKEYGIYHAAVMSPATTASRSSGLATLMDMILTMDCMDNKFCRGWARSDDVMLTHHGVQRLEQALKLIL